VYGCTILLKDGNLPGVLYFGPRFSNNSGDKQGITLEIHILDYKKKFTQIISTIVLNQKISVTVGSFLRVPIKFKSKQNLKIQIKSDINKLTMHSC
jgi:FAD synthase